MTPKQIKRLAAAAARRMFTSIENKTRCKYLWLYDDRNMPTGEYWSEEFVALEIADVLEKHFEREERKKKS